MATLVLGAVGAAIGANIGGAILGVSAATIGGFIGSSVGSVVDSWIVSSLAPTQRIEGARLDTLRITASTEGAIIPRVYGRMRIGGNVIWATDFREEVSTTTQGGKGGGGGKVKTTTYLYYASFAVAICEGFEAGPGGTILSGGENGGGEGPAGRGISGIGRIWADGKPMDMEGVTWRWYPGDETQAPDPFINARMGAGATPAYRGTAYVVFEELALEKYGNRLPQLSFEVFRPVADPESAEGMVRAVTMIPATGEFAYSMQIIRKKAGAVTTAENANASASRADFLESLDRLQTQAPAVESVSLVVSWFGNDLRAGNCLIRPGVEARSKDTTPAVWRVNGVTRGAAYLVSQTDGHPVYGGTPADFSVVQAIQEIKRRGLRVTFYPFILMDIPPGNTLPNPYSHNAATVGQPVHPWRGRITCSPAPGYVGTPDKTADVSAQINDFFGTATPANFSVSGTTVNWTGAAGHWAYRRMILHYAQLCAAAGGVDAFLIGSELRGLTQMRRDGTGNFPAVLRLRDLADDVRSILGAGTKLSYAADWSEYSAYRPDDGSGDVFFHMDPLWASPSIDFIGIDNYMPISDWRDGHEHLDAQIAPSIYDRAYLQSNIEGGEGFDWYYASSADRTGQDRTPITDGAGGAPWVFRTKDLRGWWSNPHRHRPGGSPTGGAFTAWVPESKPIWFTEFGCPAVDRGANQPNVFYDPKSSESFVPWFSRGWRDDAMQRAYLEATLDYWRRLANNPVSSVYTDPAPYGNRMVQLHECAAWTWDARPYPFFPALDDVWADGENWRLGHWLTGRLGAVSLQALVRALCLRAGLPTERIDVTGLWGAVEGYAINALESPRASLTTLARHFGFDAVESGGLIRFKMRGGAPVAMIAPDDMVAAADARGEAFELTRGQETELPQALKWQMARADEEYDPGVVEARRITVDASRVTAETFPVAVPPEEADRRCRRALMEAWVGRETAVFRLPPSRLAVDPGDVLTLMHDGRAMDLRVVSLADAEARSVEAILQDQAVYDLPPGAARAAALSRPVIFGGSEVIFMNLPQLVEEVPEHLPMVAAHAAPWPGEMAVFRSLSDDGFTLLQSFDTRARIGALAAPFAEGPCSRFDMANGLLVDMISGSFESVTDYALFGGANTLAVESAPDQWEIVQASRAELVDTGRYRLTRLLRGQRGTEHAMRPAVPAGARVVVLDTMIAPLAIASSDIGRAWNWRVGPASLPYTDDAYSAATFTPEGLGLRPFSVCHVEQPRLRGRTPGNLTIRWTRRDRSLVSDSWDLDEVPMSEASESYAIDILDGAAVKRTLTSTTTSVVYTSAQQSADWGALLSPGATLQVRIAQLSATRGRGTARTATLMF